MYRFEASHSAQIENVTHHLSPHSLWDGYISVLVSFLQRRFCLVQTIIKEHSVP